MTQKTETHRFAGASRYVLDDELAKIVNISMALEMPLLLKGEPGTGKTMLAHAIAEALGMPLIVLNVKSSMKLVEALYQYDPLTRLNDSRFGDSQRDVSRIEEYIRMGKIGQAFSRDRTVLIDEIDKVDTTSRRHARRARPESSISSRSTRPCPPPPWTHHQQPRRTCPTSWRCNFHHCLSEPIVSAFS
jgi:DNA polymerase III delta prime subunit